MRNRWYIKWSRTDLDIILPIKRYVSSYWTCIHILFIRPIDKFLFPFFPSVGSRITRRIKIEKYLILDSVLWHVRKPWKKENWKISSLDECYNIHGECIFPVFVWNFRSCYFLTSFICKLEVTAKIFHPGRRYCGENNRMTVTVKETTPAHPMGRPGDGSQSSVNSECAPKCCVPPSGCCASARQHNIPSSRSRAQEEAELMSQDLKKPVGLQADGWGCMCVRLLWKLISSSYMLTSTQNDKTNVYTHADTLCHWKSCIRFIYFCSLSFKQQTYAFSPRSISKIVGGFDEVKKGNKYPLESTAATPHC